jgi:Na+/proline symporter
MNTHAVGLLVFGFYLVAMVIIGLLSGKQQKSAEDLWVAGRRFGTAVMVMGLMASIMHGGSILSGVAFAAAYGGVAVLPFLSFALGFLVILVFFARKLRDMKAFTISDYMGERFCSPALRAWSALVVALSSMVYLIAQIRGMGLVLESLLGLAPLPSMALGTALFVSYVAAGGMLAVIWTNVAQFLFMWLGLLILLPAVGRAAGGFEAVLLRAEEAAPGWTSVFGTEWTWGYLFSWWLVWFVAYATRIELVTKVFIAKDAKVARYALPTTCLLVMVFLLYGNLYLGAAARVLVWDGLASPDQAFPALVRQTLGPLATAIALTGIASAAMSTTDSLLLHSGAALSHDLLRRSWHEPRGTVRSEAYYLHASRVAIVAVGGLSFLLALRTPELILAIVSYAVALVGAAFFFPLLLGLTWRRATKAAALASSIFGFLAAAAWTALTLSKVPWASAIHPIVPGLAVAFVLMVGLSPFTAETPTEGLRRFFPDENGANP